MQKRNWTSCLIATGILATAASTHGDIINVPDDQPTIDDAVFVASDGDEIVVQPGIWDGITKLPVSTTLTIRSTDPDDPNIVTATTMGGIGEAGGFKTKFIIKGLVITGLISTQNVDYEFVNCAFIGGRLNVALSGGTATNCTFLNAVDNLALGGGAVNLCEETSWAFVDCTFYGNRTTERGGAIQLVGFQTDSVSLTRCTVCGNSSGSDGGAIAIINGSLSLRDCSIVNNTAGGDGGGIYLQSEVAKSYSIRNSEVQGNSALGVGGGLSNANQTTSVTFINGVVCANSPDQIDGSVSGSLSTGPYCAPPLLLPSNSCLADLDGDGNVGFPDLTLLLARWGACP